MPFALLPVLDVLAELYAQPRSPARFQAYLRLLQGATKADLALPVQHFNPMAKEQLAQRLRELQALGAEAVVANALAGLAAAPPGQPLIRVALNLADDAHGGWTNRCTTDFANKFDLGASLKRGFCTPIVWASEAFSAPLIGRRTLAQAWRCRYWLAHPRPRTLAEHLAQEVYVVRQLDGQKALVSSNLQPAQAAYNTHAAATEAPTLLAFFMGMRPPGSWPIRRWVAWRRARATRWPALGQRLPSAARRPGRCPPPFAAAPAHRGAGR